MDFFFFIVLYTVLFFSWKILQKIIQFLTFQPPPIQPKFYFSESCEPENKVQKMRVDSLNKMYLKTENSIISPYELDWNKVFVIKTEKECEVACSILIKDCVTKEHVLGFDCEWCDTGRVAIIQLASFSGFCSVFQLTLLGKVPSCLQKILSSEYIYKVGVEPYKDARRLEKDYNIQVCGTIDLRFLFSGKGEGLSALCKNVLGIELDKKLRRSNWKSKELTKGQVYYAAKDAFVATQLYQFKEVETPELFCDRDYSSKKC